MKKKSEKKKRSRPLLEPTVQQGGENSSGLARALGSTDRDTREKGLVLLSNWLEAHEDISQNDLIRLWKALYFCFWHSDLVSVQTALADRLSGLLYDLSPPVAFSYFKGFVETMKREWAGIDQHRMNKYLILVRKFYAACLELFKRSNWDLELITSYTTLLKNDVILLPTANDLSAGFAYYLCDIAIPELEKCQDAPISNDALVSILDPFVQGIVHTRNKILLKKIHHDVFETLAEHVERVPFTALHIMAMAEELFRMGSDSETHPRNRKHLYTISSHLEKVSQAQEKKKSKSQERKPTGNKTTKKKQSRVETDSLQEELQPKKKKSKKTERVADAVPSGSDIEKPETQLRKSVRINLKKNLVRRIGEPPFPENVRTPPTSKPKGSALKQKVLENPASKQALTFDDQVKGHALPSTSTGKKTKSRKTKS